MDAVLNWLWQGAVVAAALAVMLFALERARANVRYVVCWTAALFVLALPVFPALQTVVSVDAIGISDTDPLVALPQAWWTSTRVLLGAAAVWVGINIIRLLSAIVAVSHARRRSRPFPAHLEALLPHWCQIRSEGRRATLVLSNSVASAAVLGWGAPMIAVAPSLLRTLHADDLERVLIHEWAHVQRRDDVLNILQVVTRVIGGWHPALWWIDRRLQVEREVACDEMAVALTGLPKSYAECLVKLSGLEATPRAIETAPAIFTPSSLRARVVKIVSPAQPIATAWSRALAAAIVLTLCVVSVVVGSVTLVDATALVEPVVSAATLTRTLPLPLVRQAAGAAAQSNAKSEPAPRPTANRPQPRQRPTEQPASPPPTVAPSTPPAEPNAARLPPETIPADVPEAIPQGDATPVAPTPPPPPAQTAEAPPSPWSAAASGGSAIGRKSKDAGVATAGFFTRFARRVAGSF